MTDASSGDATQSPTTAMATLAMLKANYDARMDHVALFEPFVMDAAASLSDDGFSTAELRQAAVTRHSLDLPDSIVRTVADRAVRRGFMSRDGGRYFLTDSFEWDAELPKRRAKVEARQSLLAEALGRELEDRGEARPETEDCLALIFEFLATYHQQLVLGPSPEGPIAGEAGLERQLAGREVVVTTFLAHIAGGQGELTEILQEALEGFIIRNTLLLRGISGKEPRFRRMHVFCDSGIILGILGLKGTATQVATKEQISLLKESGAVVHVFRVTVDEVCRILAVYEDRLGTQQGRLSLYPTDVTRYLLTQHYTPSDIQTEISLIEENLRSLGITIRDVPNRVPRLTLNESELARRLSSEAGDEDSARVRHDVDCVAGVLVLRRGYTSNSWDDSQAVFMTSHFLPARNIGHWYRDEGMQGVPPAITDVFLSNLAWLKSPASASRLKLHEFVGLCSAALKPSSATWMRFVDHLRKLQQDGELSSDEAIAIVASNLVERMLVEEGVGADSDASTISEVVARVKQTYRDEADSEIAAEQEKARRSEDRARRAGQSVDVVCELIARWVCRTALAVALLVLIAGLGVTLAQAAGRLRPALWAGVAVIGLVLVTVLSSVLGVSLISLERAVEASLARRLRDWMMRRIDA